MNGILVNACKAIDNIQIDMKNPREDMTFRGFLNVLFFIFDSILGGQNHVNST